VKNKLINDESRVAAFKEVQQQQRIAIAAIQKQVPLHKWKTQDITDIVPIADNHSKLTQFHENLRRLRSRSTTVSNSHSQYLWLAGT